MSNRTLIEINHDQSYLIEDSERRFKQALTEYLKGGSQESIDELEYFGVRVIGMKHHSEGHDIVWGKHKELLTA